ncbi:MAG: carbonic anhydrase [Myxococcota bacterium]
MRRYFPLILAALVVLPVASRSSNAPAVSAPRTPAVQRALEMLRDIHNDNARFVHEHDSRYFAPFRDTQSPRAVMLTCADSRFHANAVDASPDGDLFEVRNIGNQLDLSLGSVEYGVRHLHVPMLLIVGHVGCGAVRAAMEDYGHESPSIRRDLDGLHLPVSHAPAEGTLEGRWRAAVMANVHDQVDHALAEFSSEVEAGKLLVVGAVYDFRGELQAAPGTLHVLNVNGRRDGPLLSAARAATR